MSAMMGGWMLLWGLLALALLVLAVVAAVWLVKNLSSGPRAPSQAEEGLRRRYAAEDPYGPERFPSRLTNHDRHPRTGTG